MRRPIALALVALVVVVLVGVGAAQGASGRVKGTLNGTVGPGSTITLSKKSVTAGKYKFVIKDKASMHNFHLTGPGGIDVATDVGETGEDSFDVTLQAGEYRFICDPHASSMNGTFTVG